MPNYLQGQVKGKKIILASDFQKKPFQANQEWSNIFKNVKGKKIGTIDFISSQNVLQISKPYKNF